MAKLLLTLLIGLTFESTGIVLLKKGMNRLEMPKAVSVSGVVRVVKAAITSPYILPGVFFQALYFMCLLILMSESDITVLWPLTSLTFVFSTVAAILFLHERVSGFRWAGVGLIMLGAAFITYSEQSKPKPPPEPEPATRAVQ